MKSLYQFGCAIAFSTIVVTTTTVKAHDGHDHANCDHSRSSAYESNQYPTARYQYAPTTRGGSSVYSAANDQTQGCAAGGCCSGAGSCSVDANGRYAPTNGPRRSTVSTPDQLERLARQMATVVQSELRGRRDYNSLMADADEVILAAQRMRQAQSRRVSADVMLEEARAMLTPLKRMNSSLKGDRQAQSSVASVQEVGRVLVAFGSDLQAVVSGPRRSDRDLRPPRSDQANRSGGLAVSIPADMKGVALLSANEQAAALRQRTCPITGGPLGSMGKPILVSAAGRSVYVCCQGCVGAVQKNPEKYMTSQPGPLRRDRSMTRDQYPPMPRTTTPRRSGTNIPSEMKDVALLSPAEQQVAMRQRTCPVTGELLGSMGKPILVTAAGRSIYVCCQGCVNAVKRSPQKYMG